jgi:hypothetical protein
MPQISFLIRFPNLSRVFSNPALHSPACDARNAWPVGELIDRDFGEIAPASFVSPPLQVPFAGFLSG